MVVGRMLSIRSIRCPCDLRWLTVPLRVWFAKFASMETRPASGCVVVPWKTCDESVPVVRPEYVAEPCTGIRCVGGSLACAIPVARIIGRFHGPRLLTDRSSAQATDAVAAMAAAAAINNRLIARLPLGI